jgi:hypothetical protein
VGLPKGDVSVQVDVQAIGEELIPVPGFPGWLGAESAPLSQGAEGVGVIKKFNISDPAEA